MARTDILLWYLVSLTVYNHFTSTPTLLSNFYRPRLEPLHIRRIHQLLEESRHHDLARLHQRQMPLLRPVLLCLLALPAPLLLRSRIVRFHLLLAYHSRLVEYALHARENLLTCFREGEFVGGHIVWGAPAGVRREVDLWGGGCVYGFDEAGYHERGKHVTCAGEEEWEFGGVYPEEAGVEVGGCS